MFSTFLLVILVWFIPIATHCGSLLPISTLLSLLSFTLIFLLYFTGEISTLPVTFELPDSAALAKKPKIC